MIALVLGLGRKAGEVGAGARLGIALAPADFAARDLRQEMLLLLLGAELQQRRAEHGDAEAGQRRARAEPRHLFLQDLRLRGRKPAATIVLRPMRDGPAFLAHPLHPLTLSVALEGRIAAAPAGVRLRPHRLAHLRRAIRLQPRARFRTESLDFSHFHRRMFTNVHTDDAILRGAIPVRASLEPISGKPSTANPILEGCFFAVAYVSFRSARTDRTLVAAFDPLQTLLAKHATPVRQGGGNGNSRTTNHPPEP